MEFRLRPAKEEDRDWAYALKKDAYLEVVERQFGEWDEGKEQQHFGGRWNPAISQIVIVNGADVGLIAIEEKLDCLVLDEIQLLREWRSKGLGTQMVNDLLSRARSQNKPVKLEVLRENFRAQRLYERLGFKQIGSTETHNVMEMSKALATPEKRFRGNARG